MSSPKTFCSPEEIAEKRRIALERLQKSKELKSQNAAQNENKVGFERPNILKSNCLTAEQKANIERKRLAAIERLAKSKEASVLKIPSSTNMSQKIHNQGVKRPSEDALGPVHKVPRSTEANHVQKLPNQSQTVNSSNQKPDLSKLGKGPSAMKKASEKPPFPVSCTFEMIRESRFAVHTDYFNQRVIDEFKKIKSRGYNEKNRSWTFNISDYEELKDALERLGSSNAKLVAIPDFVIKTMRKNFTPVDDTIFDNIEPEIAENLFSFQRDGVKFGISHGGRFLLADDMGLGKTRQALAVADFYKDDWPLLILTTATLRNWWHTQVLDLLPNVPIHNVSIVESSKDSIFDAKVVICSYSGIENNKERLMQKKFGVIIFDESHSIKNSSSKQSMNSEKLSSVAKRVILVSGTPALSRPAELFPQLNIIDPGFTNFHNFSIRYCEGHQSTFGWDARGSSNLSELSILLRKRFMIRRTKDFAMAELGEKKREVVELKTIKTDSKAMNTFSENYNKAEGRKQDQKEILLQWFTSTAQLKAEAVCDYIAHFSKESKDKFIVFVHHKNIMEAITKVLFQNDINYVKIDGSTRSDVRSLNVSKFQKDSDIQCAILSIRACSAGITLTAASTVIFAELFWTPSLILQAEARAHRIGQEREVRILFLIAPNSSDLVMWNMLQEKQKNLTKVGIQGANEDLSRNIEKSTFSGGPSTSKAVKRIDQYFITSPRQSAGETSGQNLDPEWAAGNLDSPVKNLQEISNPKSPQDFANPKTPEDIFYSCELMDDDEVIDLEEIKKLEQQERNAKNEKAKTESMQIQELLYDIDFDNMTQV